MKSLARSLVLAVLCIAPLASCASDPKQGYVLGSAYDDSIKSVHVPIFQNSTFSRGVEIELTDAIIKEIQSKTPWKVVRSESAGATLSGAITESRLTNQSVARTTGLVQEQGVQLTLQFEFKDNRTGKVLTARRNFTGSGTFIPSQGVGERLETGRHDAIQSLARDVVAELRAGW